MKTESIRKKLTFEIIWILREMRQRKKKRKRMKETEIRKEQKNKQTQKI